MSDCKRGSRVLRSIVIVCVVLVSMFAGVLVERGRLARVWSELSRSSDQVEQFAAELENMERYLTLSDKMVQTVTAIRNYYVDSIKLDSIKTKDFRAFLTAINAEGKSLVVTPAKDEIVIKSARNIPGVETTMANLINVYDVLNAKKLVVDQEALRKIEEVFA